MSLQKQKPVNYPGVYICPCRRCAEARLALRVVAETLLFMERHFIRPRRNA